jgi:protein TonB
MAKDINLTSQKWLELVFEGKNKEYGAYVMRDTSSDRHIKALGIVLIVVLALIFLPNIITSVIPHSGGVIQNDGIQIAQIDQEIPEDNQIKEVEPIAPPPLLKETIKMTELVITKDEVKEEDLMLNQQELTDNQVAISIATVEGVKEGGVDIADIKEHIVAVKDDKPEIFSHVEVSPQFPGGDKELLKWLSDNLVYPTIAAEQGIQGQVVLRFVVGPDGSVGQVEVLRSLDPSCDREATRVVKKMPKWIPGKQNGSAVYVWYNLPVRFRLQN